MATASASSRGKTLGSSLRHNEGKELKQNNQYCSLCEDDADFFCNTCNSILCHQCKESHKRQKATKTHDVVHISNADPLCTAKEIDCEIHTGDAIQHYCKQCEMGICATCIKGDHRKHDILSLSDAKENIKDMCLEKVKKLQVPLSKMKSKLKQLTVKQKHESDDTQHTKAELLRRKDKLISFITLTVDGELNKMESDESKIRTNVAQLSTELGKQIDKCETLLTPIMSVVLKENVHDILKCVQNINSEEQKANNILARIDHIGHSVDCSLTEDDISQLETDIKNYLRISKTQRLNKTAKTQNIINGLQIVNKTKTNIFYYFPSRICPENFYVQCAARCDILQLSCNKNGDVTECKMNKMLQGKGLNNFGRSLLTLSPSRSIVIKEQNICLCDNNGVLKTVPHSSDKYIPNNIAYVSEKEFITVCADQKKIRFYDTKSLDILQTVDISVHQITDKFIGLTSDEEVILFAYASKDSNLTLMKFTKEGKLIEELQMHKGLFESEIGAISMINDQMIGLKKDGSIHAFSFDGETACIGNVGNDVSFVWGLSVDYDNHVYVSYSLADDSDWVARFKLLFK